MEIEYTIKIKDKHNPPEFKEGLGKGVLMTVIADFKGLTKEDMENDPVVQLQITELAEHQLKEYVEVSYKVKDDETGL